MRTSTPHYRLLVVSWLLVASFISPAQAAKGYDFYCRGPFDVESAIIPQDTETVAKGALIISFARNRSRAGRNGSQLQTGTCAWWDRPTNNREPSRLLFKLARATGVDERGGAEIVYPGDIPGSLSAQMIIHCASDSNCVVKFEKVSRSGSHLVTNDPVVKMIRRR